MTMKALTLWQPWASLVATGAKRIETRSCVTKYRGPLAIHAAKEVGADSCDSAFPLWSSERFDEFARQFYQPPGPKLFGPDFWALHPDELAG